MATHRAEIAVWFAVEFDDDGVNDLKDQAHDAALGFLDIPYLWLSDTEVVDVVEIKP